MEKNIINCTPHAVSLVGEDGNILVTIPSSGMVPRVAESFRDVATVGLKVGETIIPCKLVVSQRGDVTGLPEERDDTLVVVSGLVLDHPGVRHRRDLVAPGRVSRFPAGHPQAGLVSGAFELRVAETNLDHKSR